MKTAFQNGIFLFIGFCFFPALCGTLFFAPAIFAFLLNLIFLIFAAKLAVKIVRWIFS